MNNNTPLANINAFVVVTQAGSFTKAAEQLNVSRAHLSRQIAQLESTLGAQLLIRTTRTQRLTDAGERFFHQCQRGLQTIETAVEGVADEGAALRGNIIVNCVGGIIGEELIARIISEFAVLHPDVRITLDLSSHRVDMIAEQFDVVFRMGALEDSGLVGRKLMDIEIDTLASPTYLESHGYPQEPKDLEHHRCLTGSVQKWDFIPSKQDINKKGGTQSVTVPQHFVSKNGRVLMQAAISHNGIIRIPRLYCEQAIADGLLAPVFKDWQVSPAPFYLLYHHDKHQPQRIKQFIEFVMNRFE